MQFDMDWVDAFADRPFGGNGCAVVHGGAGLDDATCMAFVRETGLVECTFTGPSDSADVRVRYFLASKEIPFAGHPTLATVAALRARGRIAGDRITLDLHGKRRLLAEHHRRRPPRGPETLQGEMDGRIGLPTERVIVDEA